MRTYKSGMKYGGSDRLFNKEGYASGRENDVIDLLCGAGMEKQEWLKETENYLKSLQQEDGSFGWSHGQNHYHYNVMTTGYAVLSLKAIGCDDADVFEKAKKYILSRRHEDGSFGSFGWTEFDSKGSVDRLFYAITTLKAIEGFEKGSAAILKRLQTPLEGFDRHKKRGYSKPSIGHEDKRVLNECREYIESIENLDGGFGSTIGVPSDIEYTSMALQTLKAAGVQKKDMPVSRKYVMSLKKGDGNGGFGNAVRTSHAILALQALDCEVPEDSKEYIRRFRNDGTNNVDVARLYNTMLGLFAAGERDIPNEYEDYAMKLKNPDGGFGKSASDRQSNVKNTYHAIMTIKTVHKSEMNKQ